MVDWTTAATILAAGPGSSNEDDSTDSEPGQSPVRARTSPARVYRGVRRKTTPVSGTRSPETGAAARPAADAFTTTAFQKVVEELGHVMATHARQEKAIREIGAMVKTTDLAQISGAVKKAIEDNAGRIRAEQENERLRGVIEDLAAVNSEYARKEEAARHDLQAMRSDYRTSLQAAVDLRGRFEPPADVWVKARLWDDERATGKAVTSARTARIIAAESGRIDLVLVGLRTVSERMERLLHCPVGTATPAAQSKGKEPQQEGTEEMLGDFPEVPEDLREAGPSGFPTGDILGPSPRKATEAEELEEVLPGSGRKSLAREFEEQAEEPEAAAEPEAEVAEVVEESRPGTPLTAAQRREAEEEFRARRSKRKTKSGTPDSGPHTRARNNPVIELEE